ncbi:molybdenum cofactor biosysynthesis protein [Novosphingobium resinovorum]|uniref:Molybdenum cofactor biosysynthesis protein n=2 Tax=Sphingomonadaceae TaxID=41297 RepID=A0A1D8A0X9_9SPHN|nr:molybdenum cofactor biosysynthesis protein [Novosphingobium resinovorum]
MRTGRLIGIARRQRPRAPMEELRSVAVTAAAGVHGDFRGAVRPGKRPHRQVSLMEIESWRAALGELEICGGLFGFEEPPWHARRANLLVEGLRFPRETGYVLAIGNTLRIAVTMECDPCSRMEEVAQGLKGALLPDWRGGVLGTVLDDGDIALGDEIRIER